MFFYAPMALAVAAVLAVSGCGSRDPFYARNLTLIDTLHAHDTISQPSRKYVIRGGAGQLFYLEDVRAAVTKWGSLESNAEAIGRLSADLSAKGKRLLVVPVPTKVETYPEWLGRADTGEVSPSKERFLAALAAVGVEFLDLWADFRKAKATSRLFPRTDTHWDQSAIDVAASAISARLRLVRDSAAGAGCDRDTVLFGFRGDLAEKFQDPALQAETDTVPLRVACDTAAWPYALSDSARVMLYGDSFLNQYKRFGAGLGARLALRLGEPVRTIYSLAGFTDGPGKMRVLSEEAPGTRVVVWVFTSRTLMEAAR